MLVGNCAKRGGLGYYKDMTQEELDKAERVATKNDEEIELDLDLDMDMDVRCACLPSD